MAIVAYLSPVNLIFIRTLRGSLFFSSIGRRPPGLLVGWDGTEKRIPWDDRLLFIPWDGMTLKIPHPTWDGTIFKKFLSHGMGRF
jgi:hypothetical protein